MCHEILKEEDDEVPVASDNVEVSAAVTDDVNGNNAATPSSPPVNDNATEKADQPAEVDSNSNATNTTTATTDTPSNKTNGNAAAATGANKTNNKKKGKKAQTNNGTDDKLTNDADADNTISVTVDNSVGIKG